MLNIVRSSVCSGFGAVGTAVLDHVKFFEFVTAAVEKCDFTAQQVPGQAFIPLPTEAFRTVSCGVGRHTHRPEDYVVRVHRGEAAMFLKREHAAPVESLAVVVYTRNAYLNDPDVLQDQAEADRIRGITDCTHVLVTIIAAAGPKPALSPWRFVCNLAGGNRAYEPANTTVEKLNTEAALIREYHTTWCTVAD